MIRSAAVSLGETFISGNLAAVAALRRTISDGNHEFISPGLGDWFLHNLDEPVQRNAWLLMASQNERRWVLAFAESDEPLPGAKKEGFLLWLERFAPSNCNDWLMVPYVYTRHVFDEESVDWTAQPFPLDAFLDRFLQPSRGLLLWKDQFLDLLGDALGLSGAEALQKRNRYLQQKPDTIELFQRTCYRGRPLASIVEERTLGRGFIAGRPDFHLSGFLSAVQGSL